MTTETETFGVPDALRTPDISAFLEALRRIEATTPYRLGRRSRTGELYFAAPRIYLDGK
jgi:hypothetical protein